MFTEEMPIPVACSILTTHVKEHNLIIVVVMLWGINYRLTVLC